MASTVELTMLETAEILTNSTADPADCRQHTLAGPVSVSGKANSAIGAIAR